MNFRLFLDNLGLISGLFSNSFSRLFLDNHDRISETIFRQSRTVLRFGFSPGTDVFGFYGVFWYHNIR